MPKKLLINIADKIDWPLFIITAVLVCVGLATLYSASSGNIHFVVKQLIHATIGFALMLYIAMIPHSSIKDWAPLLYLSGNFLLIAVLALGFISKGAQRWLGFGSMHIQPSELMKIFLPLCLCWFFAHRENPPKASTIIIGVFLAIIPVALVYKQPDLGTALVILFLAGVAIFLSGISRKFIISAFIGITCLLPILWSHMHNYQKKRILTFLDPEADPLGAGYHIMQSKIAVGSGGLAGKGYMLGSQAQLNFLPEHTTDFIFAVIAEESGFIGCSVVILLVLLLSLRIFSISSNTLPGFCQNACACLGCLYFISALVNMSMVVGLLPVVGIPLPLISYGGSNMLITCASIGIVMSLKNNWKRKHATDNNQ